MKETTGFPFELTTMNLSTTGDTVIPIDLAQNVSKLHQFLFNETDYQPTETVQTVSDKIAKKTGVTSKTSAFDLTQYNDTVGSDGTEGAKKKNKDKQDIVSLKITGANHRQMIQMSNYRWYYLAVISNKFYKTIFMNIFPIKMVSVI